MEISDIKLIKESLNEKRNLLPSLIGIVIGIYYLHLIRVVDDIITGDFHFSYYPYLNIYFYSLISWWIWIFRIITAFFVYGLARKKERLGIFWFICALLFPSITLVILGLLKKKIKDNELKELITSIKKKFVNEKITNKLIIQEEIELKFIEKLKKERIAFLNNQQLEKDILIKQIKLMEKGIEINIENNEVENISFCEACNSKYINGALFCPECLTEIVE